MSLPHTLLAIEHLLLSPSTPSAELADALDRDFCEFGASGRVYDKPAILSLLAQRAKFDYELAGFRVTTLGPDAALATYTCVRTSDGRSQASRRSSVFIRRDGTWRMRFHQGTPCPPDPAPPPQTEEQPGASTRPPT